MTIDESIAQALNEETLKEAAKSAPNKVCEVPTVSIPLDEYREMQLASIDLNRFIAAIENDLELGYCGDSLRIKGDDIINTYKALFPDAYARLYNELHEKVNS